MQPKVVCYVVEWSPSQRCFHIQPLADAVAGNLAKWLDAQADPAAFFPDYVPLALCATRREATEVCEKLNAVRSRRLVGAAAGDGWPR